ncbi:MAG TPA: hypothetical protein VMF06_05570 [Candidatus Limnocylindria bacterium]|nr:hypothetical protein [Candidatus Limnocylindria bacterium]
MLLLSDKVFGNTYIAARFEVSIPTVAHWRRCFRIAALLAACLRYYVHYTLTYSSWLNQVEPWFGSITPQAIRRGSVSSVKELVRQIDALVEHCNQNSKPFAWIGTPESILEKIGRLPKLICETPH